MESISEFEIVSLSFDRNVLDDKTTFDQVSNWPIVYLLSSEEKKIIYIGETTNVEVRLSDHIKNETKAKLTFVRLISSHLFNKSATLDIEANLIQYMAADSKYKLINVKGGSRHEYHQKDKIYWPIFEKIWDKLRYEGIAVHSLQHLSNSDLFKYSPYKSLLGNQLEVVDEILDHLISDDVNNMIAEGSAGTGKTIVGIYLFKILMTYHQNFEFDVADDIENRLLQKVKLVRQKFPKLRMALVIPVSSFRKTMKSVFGSTKGLRSNMVIGPAALSREKYDIVIVDESHRLRRAVNLGTYSNAFKNAARRLEFVPEESNELDFAIKQSNKLILFYDEYQSVRPGDVRKEDFDKLKENKATALLRLKSQFRVNGGNGYLSHVNNILNHAYEKIKLYKHANYEFLLFESLEDMIEKVQSKEKKFNLSRLLAGFSWPWISKTDSTLKDIKIGDLELRWNHKSIDWINSENAINEVGCIHTAQGYDLNYAGVIFGNEIVYNPEKKRIEIREDYYFDRNGKSSIKDPRELKKYIINIYKTLLTRGIYGTYVYACDVHLRNYLSNWIPTISQSNSEEIQLDKTENLIPFKNAVPFYDITIAAGHFKKQPNKDNVDDWLYVGNDNANLDNLFACRVLGESMNKVIPNGAIAVFKKYAGGSRNGMIVLVKHTEVIDSDYGSGYTIKEYYSEKVVVEGNWKHSKILLKPVSTDDSYKPIRLLSQDEGKFEVLGVFVRVLE